MAINAGRLDDCFREDHEENIAREQHRMLVFIARLNSLALTQASIAVDYQHWADEGGSSAGYYAKEAARLNAESQKNADRAKREQENMGL